MLWYPYLTRDWIRAMAAAAFVASAPADGATAHAKTNRAKTDFDGLWSVVIVTTKGECDRVYRYPVTIRGGKLINAGSESFEISGKIRTDGALTVEVRHGEKRATGAGRLSANGGSGSWNGGGCAGTWTAERRAAN